MAVKPHLKRLLRIAVCLACVATAVLIRIGALSTNCEHPPAARVLSDFSVIEVALILFEAKCNRLPTTEQGLTALTEKPEIEPVPLNWSQQMKMVPLDPWGNEYEYRFPSFDLTKRYDLISAGPDGVFATADDITNE